MKNRYRFPLLSLALFLSLLAPFGLYLALQNGLEVLSYLSFGLILLSMALAVWAG